MLVYNFYDTDARVIRYANALAERGDQVDVVALRRPGKDPVGDVHGVRVFSVQRRTFNEKRQLTYAVRLLEFFLRCMFFLTFRRGRSRYDIVHVHSVPDFLVFAAWFPKLYGAKIILDIHDLVPELYASKFGETQQSGAYRFLLWVERISAAFADHVISANDIWQDTLVSRCATRNRCTCFVNLPEAAVFRPGLRNRTDDKFIILYPGTLNLHQGVDIAVRAFARIAATVPNTEFQIYGRGPAMPHLKQLARELHLENRMMFRDIVARDEIAVVMANADLAVVPKRKDSFGNQAFSTKIMEFMCVGVPVIVSDTKIDKYYFTDDVVRFFRSGDEENLVEEMLLLIRDPALRSRLAQNGLAFVAKNNWGLKKAEYLKLVDSLVNSQREALALA